jgi:O-methyltransferase
MGRPTLGTGAASPLVAPDCIVAPMPQTSPGFEDGHVRALHHGATDSEPDGATCLEHPQTGLRYRLNESSAYLWSLLEQESRLSVLAERMVREFGLDSTEAATEISSFVERMGDLGFVGVDDGSEASRLRTLYLDLLKAALVNTLYPEHELRIELLEKQGRQPDHARAMRDIRYADPTRFAELLTCKADGRNWYGRVTRFSHTMIGLRRLQNLEWCASRLFREGVEGDFMEAGVCQGGAAIFMRALQLAHAEGDRRMWLADSFEGLPEPVCAVDQGYDFQEAVQPWLAASLEAVQDNFRTYGLLSDQVRFIPGWFDRTLAHAPVERLAMLRIDADLYASTIEVLRRLYDKVAPGGFVIVDDYHVFPPCKVAVDEFREAEGITEPLVRIDWSAIFWRKRR